MKKLLLSLSLVIVAFAARAEGSGWFFVYDGNSWATDETTEFKTTDTPNVFLLANYAVTADAAKGGFNYQVTDKSWSKMYGWCAEADGHDIVGEYYKLGSTGNAWINCQSGSYDIYLNMNDETIKFAIPQTDGIEGVTVSDNSPAEYYTITGVRVAEGALTPGIYIRKQGKKISKIMLR